MRETIEGSKKGMRTVWIEKGCGESKPDGNSLVV
jgi:hypothetical protein